jgi:TRAP-type mannitol/chloroaromatic compound transport system permease small subunit
MMSNVNLLYSVFFILPFYFAMIFLVVYVRSVSFMKHNLATLEYIYNRSKWGFTSFDVFLLSVHNYLSFRNKT